MRLCVQHRRDVLSCQCFVNFHLGSNLNAVSEMGMQSTQHQQRRKKKGKSSKNKIYRDPTDINNRAPPEFLIAKNKRLTTQDHNTISEKLSNIEPKARPEKLSEIINTPMSTTLNKKNYHLSELIWASIKLWQTNIEIRYDTIASRFGIHATTMIRYKKQDIFFFSNLIFSMLRKSKRRGSRKNSFRNKARRHNRSQQPTTCDNNKSTNSQQPSTSNENLYDEFRILIPTDPKDFHEYCTLYSDDQAEKDRAFRLAMEQKSSESGTFELKG